MLTTTKMTGLNLGGTASATSVASVIKEDSTGEAGSGSSKRSSTSSEEMLTTPKFLPDSATLLTASPPFTSTTPSPLSKKAMILAHVEAMDAKDREAAAAAASQNGEGGVAGGGGGGANNDGDMLMTPVVTTPKTADLWPPTLKMDMAEAGGASPESSASPTRMVPREPPTDLPITGLSSPCQGALAKRRSRLQKQCSDRSDSNNSCDTPTSENSPRDLTTSSSRSNSKSVGSPIAASAVSSSTNVVVAASTTAATSNSSIPTVTTTAAPSSSSSSPSAIKPSTPTIIRNSPEIPPASPGFKFPHAAKPENLRLNNLKDLREAASASSSSSGELPAHYNPSPLDVPSPNWIAVSRMFGDSLLKTPKQLTDVVFDFLTPATPRSAKFPAGGADADGRYQKLSPRTSPRFPIPEAPTDLSSTGNAASVTKEEAEDLSMSTATARSTLAHLQQQQHQPPPQLQPHQFKQEPRGADTPPAPPPHVIPMDVDVKMEPVIGGHHGEIVHQPPHGGPPPHPPHGQEYDFRVFAAAAASGYGLNPALYRNHLYSRPSPSPPNRPTPTSTPHMDHYGREHQNTSPAPPPPPYHTAASHPQNWPPGGPPQDGGINQMPWSSADEEASVSPPHPLSTSYKPPPPIITTLKANATSGGSVATLMSDNYKKAAALAAASKLTPPTGSGLGPKKGPEAKKKSPNKAPKTPAKDANGAKRVYTCPNCQRSYDWNYNLNRHLKYECGKENAFQCAKCGRKFPHKQNCVYHLKRKHKVVCDTIDQYMSAGLVLFRGQSNPGGQQIANPQDATSK